MERRLTAILAADMVGYSRLVEADEVGTLNRQKHFREQLIDPKIDLHGGTIVKLTGDGMIAEFPSVVEAVQCAVSVQREMETREASVPADRRIRYRIAVNLGDVIFDDGDVYGDGVNIASRLEGLADPGGVIVSGTAYDHLKTNVEVGYEDLGEQRVKNIATPVRAYKVIPDGKVVKLGGYKRVRRITITAVAAVAVVFTAIVTLEFSIQPEPENEINIDRKSLLSIPEGPSIAVLRFENRSDDPEQDWFADGIALETIAALGQHPRLNLITKSSTFALSDDDKIPTSVRRLLGADYVLDGWVQRLPEKVRVGVELYDALTGGVTWSKIYEEPMKPENLVEVQTAIAERTAVAIGEPDWGAITEEQRKASLGKPPSSMTAYECTLYSAGDWYRPGALKRMHDCSLEAIKREPNYAPVWAALSLTYRIDAWFEFGLAGIDRAEGVRRAIEAAETAVRLNPDDPEARFNLMSSYMASGDCERFRTEAQRYLNLGWKSTNRMAVVGGYLGWSGEWELGTDIVQKAITLSSEEYPRSWNTVFAAEFAKNGNHKAALEKYREAAIPGFFLSDVNFAHRFAAVGRMGEAKEAIGNLLKKRPNYTIQDYVDFQRMWCWDEENLSVEVENLFAAGLPSGGYEK